MGLLESINLKTKFKGIIILLYLYNLYIYIYIGIVLSANGTKYISKEDINIIEHSGICVIDCSWARISEIKLSFPNERLLPHMV